MEQFLVTRDQLQFLINTLNEISDKNILPLKYSLPIIDLIRNLPPNSLSQQDFDRIKNENSEVKNENEKLKLELNACKIDKQIDIFTNAPAIPV